MATATGCRHLTATDTHAPRPRRTKATSCTLVPRQWYCTTLACSLPSRRSQHPTCWEGLVSGQQEMHDYLAKWLPAKRMGRQRKTAPEWHILFSVTPSHSLACCHSRALSHCIRLWVTPRGLSRTSVEGCHTAGKGHQHMSTSHRHAHS